jgi:hypothetical protein
VHEVHKMMSWDEDGCPLPATLIDHQLEWAMDDGRDASGRGRITLMAPSRMRSPSASPQSACS